MTRLIAALLLISLPALADTKPTGTTPAKPTIPTKPATATPVKPAGTENPLKFDGQPIDENLAAKLVPKGLMAWYTCSKKDGDLVKVMPGCIAVQNGTDVTSETHVLVDTKCTDVKVTGDACHSSGYLVALRSRDVVLTKIGPRGRPRVNAKSTFAALKGTAVKTQAKAGAKTQAKVDGYTLEDTGSLSITVYFRKNLASVVEVAIADASGKVTFSKTETAPNSNTSGSTDGKKGAKHRNPFLLEQTAPGGQPADSEGPTCPDLAALVRQNFLMGMNLVLLAAESLTPLGGTWGLKGGGGPYPLEVGRTYDMSARMNQTMEAASWSVYNTANIGCKLQRKQDADAQKKAEEDAKAEEEAAGAGGGTRNPDDETSGRPVGAAKCYICTSCVEYQVYRTETRQGADGSTDEHGTVTTYQGCQAGIWDTTPGCKNKGCP